MKGFLFNQIRLLGTKIVGGDSPRSAAYAVSLVVTAALSGVSTDAAAQVPHSGDINGDGTIDLYDSQCAVLLYNWDAGIGSYPGCAAFPETLGGDEGADAHDMNCDQTNGTIDHEFTTDDTTLIIYAALSSSALEADDPNYDGENVFLHQNCRQIGCPYSNSGFDGVAAGGLHSCALDEDGFAWCWGSDPEGQLGNHERTGSTSTPTQVVRGEPYKSIAGHAADTGSHGHTCAIRAAGVYSGLEDTLWCWGYNYSGQLGIGDNVDRTIPVMVGDTDDKWESVAPGRDHTCAIKKDGSDRFLYCWGSDANDQLGLGSGDDTSTTPSGPVAEISSADWMTVTAGTVHTCAINSNGDGYCWGDNTYGQLGDGSYTSQNAPNSTHAISGSYSWVALATFFQATCGLVDVMGSDKLYCWGSNSYGALGVGQSYGSLNDSNSPMAVDSGNTYAHVWLGANYGCGITGGGSPRLRCWGRNSAGQLGYSTSPYSESTSPADVDASDDWVEVALGYAHTCGIKDDGGEELYCWGEGSNGQLGDGSTSDNATPGLVNEFELECCGDSICDSPEVYANCSADCDP